MQWSNYIVNNAEPTSLPFINLTTNVMNNKINNNEKTYKFTDGTILTESQVMQRYNLEDDCDLEIWGDDHYATQESINAHEHLYNF